MELKEFVQATLENIIDGVQEAQKNTKQDAAYDEYKDCVNPQLNIGHGASAKNKHYLSSDKQLIHFVDFDVMISAEEVGKAGGGISVKVMGLGANTDAGVTTSSSAVNKVKFSVPIKYKSSSPEN